MPKNEDRKRPIGNCEIARADTDYPEKPDHRGHTVTIEGWSETYVMLVIQSDDGKTNEALITPDQLIELAEKAKAEAHKW